MALRRKTKGILAAVVVYIIWGFTLLASTLAQREASPSIFLAYRFVIATVVMLIPVLLGRQRLSFKGKNLWWLLALALAEPVIYFPCEQFGLKYTNSSFTGIMISVIPVFTMLLAAVIFKDRPSALQWLFTFVSIGGVIAITLINGSDSGAVRPLGVLFLAGAVICGGAYGILCRKLADSFSIYEKTFVTLFMGALFFAVWALLENRADLTALVSPLASPEFVLSSLYVSVFASVIGYTLLNYALENAPMANVISLNSLVTVLSVISGVLFLGEPFSLKAGIAMLVVLLGIWGVQRFGPET